jgi:micrococcal nuclease
MNNPTYLYFGIVTKVIDGDTIDCMVDLGFNTFIKERFRLYGIDTPEKNSKIPEVREIAIKATNFVKETVEGKGVTIESLEKDKYGRWLAVVHIDAVQPTLNEQLVSLELAKVYFGDSKSNIGWGTT